MSSRIIKGLCLGALLGSSTMAMADDKIVVASVPAMANVALYVAREDGIFKKHGLDVELLDAAGSAIIPGLLAGSIQIGLPTVPVSLQAADNEIEIKFIAGANVTSREQLDFGVIAGKASGILEPKDYSGKRVGVSNLHGFTDLLFNEWLKANDTDPKSVTYVEVPFPQMGDVLRQGTVDAVVALQPFLSRIVANDIGSLGPNLMLSLPDAMPVAAYIAENSWIAENGDTIIRFSAAMAEASAEVAKDPQRAKAVANTYLNLPAEALDQFPVPVLQPVLDPAKIQEWLEILRANDLVRSDIKAADLINGN
jgi:NitT/TauT family transport system substrate-binding protein